MTAVLESPLGDIRLEPVSARGWGLAIGSALVLHLAALIGWVAWQAARPAPDPQAEEMVTEVALGPPGGRLDPPPPVAAPTPEPLPKATRTERAKDAPPIAMTAPAPPAPVGAALSSGFGVGGDGLEPAPPPPEPAPPPPPPPAPAEPIDPAVLKAYIAVIGQMILEEIDYPPSARRADVEGSALLTLVIEQRGRLVSAELRQGTGHGILDEEVLKAVNRIRRYPPLPEGYEPKTLRFSVRVRFTMIDGEPL